MKLTTKTRYGVRAIFDIAYHSDGNPVSVADISERQQISPRYLEQIFKALKQAGILGTRRGPKGGYYLLKDAGEITVYDILCQVEGPLELVFCVGDTENRSPSNGASCDRARKCPARPMWKEMGESIVDVFKGTTISDLCQRAKALGVESHADRSLSYSI